MQKLLFLGFFIVCSLSCIAQADTITYNNQVKEFVNFYLQDSAKPIVVAEKLDSFTIGTLKDAISDDTIFRRSSLDNWKTVVVDTFVFSLDERHFVDSSIENMYNFSWVDALLPKSIILNQQSLDNLMASGPGMPKYLTAHFKTDKFYWLSKPIFLRNFTCCVFYVETNNGKPSGSEANLVIFLKKNQKWQKLLKKKVGQSE